MDDNIVFSQALVVFTAFLAKKSFSRDITKAGLTSR